MLKGEMNRSRKSFWKTGEYDKNKFYKLLIELIRQNETPIFIIFILNGHSTFYRYLLQKQCEQINLQR